MTARRYDSNEQDSPGDRPPRARTDSELRIRASQPSSLPSHESVEHRIERRITEARASASSLRDQGWNWEIQGRAWAYRDAAAQVRRWLLDRGEPDRATIEFVADLLERSAEVYAHGDQDRRDSDPGDRHG